MSFVNFPNPTPVFPILDSQAWSVRIRPTWATMSATFVTGVERRAARSAFPLWEFELTFEGLQVDGRDDFERLSGLFLQCNGDYGEFYYYFPDDNSRSQQFIEVSDGATTTYRVNKGYYQIGPDRYGTDPVGGLNTLLAVYLDGTPMTGGYAGSGQYISFTTAPPPSVTITADFTFFYRCSFTDPRQEYSMFLKDLWEYKVCRFRSVKP